MGEMTKDRFKMLVEHTIDINFMDILKEKSNNEKFLSYFDFLSITANVKNIFRNHLSEVPSQIEAACSLAETILAPTLSEKKDKLKALLGITGGATGIAMVIGGIGAALGWGAGIVATVTAFFLGSSIAGPIGWISGGVAVTAVAGYFVFSNDSVVNTERAIKALKSSVCEAIEIVWEEHGEKLKDVKPKK